MIQGIAVYHSLATLTGAGGVPACLRGADQPKEKSKTSSLVRKGIWAGKESKWAGKMNEPKEKK